MTDMRKGGVSPRDDMGSLDKATNILRPWQEDAPVEFSGPIQLENPSTLLG